MLTLTRRSGGQAVMRAVIVVAVIAVTLAGQKPVAADQWGDVDCDQYTNHPECQASAGETEAGAPIVGPAGEVSCRWDGETVPCRNDWGWYGHDGCYYQRQDDGPTQRDGVPGATYVPQCIGDLPNARRPAVWIPDSEAPGVAALSRVAVSRLVLPQPAFELSPPASAPQLVNLPVWLWIAPQWWVSRSASASVPGITVTAVGEPVQTRWELGDGTTKSCGAGTRYEPGGDPAAASPDCGHTYRRASAGQPGGVYEVSVTVTWEVTWSGGGLSGEVGPLFSTASTQVPVVESRSVNVGGPR